MTEETHDVSISEAYSSFEAYYLVDKDRSEKTIREYRVRFRGKNGLITVVGDIPLSFLGVDHLLQWRIHMRDQGLQAVYINHCLSGARMFLKWCSENELRVLDWRRVSFDSVEKAKPKVILNPDEIQRLVDCAPSLRDKAIIKLFFGTGIRSAEELSLDRSEWEAATLINEAQVAKGEQPIWEIYVLGKNKKYRPVLFYQNVKDMVDTYLDSRVDRFKPLFISQQNRRISYSMVSRMLHDTARRAGLTKRVTQHILRHSYVTDRAAKGMPTPLLSYNIGHANEATTQKVYTHINQMHVRHAFAKYPVEKG